MLYREAGKWFYFDKFKMVLHHNKVHNPASSKEGKKYHSFKLRNFVWNVVVSYDEKVHPLLYIVYIFL